MEIVIYTQPSCTSCVLVKSLLKRTNLEITEYVLGEDITVEEYNERYPTVDVTPLVILDGISYISIKEIAKKLLAEGLVTAPNK